MQWYYLDANKQQIPFDENFLHPLIHDGSITAQTLMWNESLTEWRPASAAFPQSFPGVQQPPAQIVSSPVPQSAPAELTAPKKKVNEDLREMVMDLASYISANAGWIKFFGVMLIIAGVPNLIFLVGGLYIWLGVMLLKAADQSRIAERTGSKEVLEQSLYQLGQFFKVNGIVMLVVIVLQLVIFVIFLAMGGLALLGLGAAAAGSMDAIPNEP